MILLLKDIQYDYTILRELLVQKTVRPVGPGKVPALINDISSLVAKRKHNDEFTQCTDTLRTWGHVTYSIIVHIMHNKYFSLSLYD